MKFNKNTNEYKASETDIKKAQAHLRRLNREAVQGNFFRCYFDPRNGDFSYPEFTGNGWINCEGLVEISPYEY